MMEKVLLIFWKVNKIIISFINNRLIIRQDIKTKKMLQTKKNVKITKFLQNDLACKIFVNIM